MKTLSTNMKAVKSNKSEVSEMKPSASPSFGHGSQPSASPSFGHGSPAEMKPTASRAKNPAKGSRAMGMTNRMASMNKSKMSARLGHVHCTAGKGAKQAMLKSISAASNGKEDGKWCVRQSMLSVNNRQSGGPNRTSSRYSTIGNIYGMPNRTSAYNNYGNLPAHLHHSSSNHDLPGTSSQGVNMSPVQSGYQMSPVQTGHQQSGMSAYGMSVLPTVSSGVLPTVSSGRQWLSDGTSSTNSYIGGNLTPSLQTGAGSFREGGAGSGPFREGGAGSGPTLPLPGQQYLNVAGFDSSQSFNSPSITLQRPDSFSSERIDSFPLQPDRNSGANSTNSEDFGPPRDSATSRDSDLPSRPSQPESEKSASSLKDGKHSRPSEGKQLQFRESNDSSIPANSTMMSSMDSDDNDNDGSTNAQKANRNSRKGDYKKRATNVNIGGARFGQLQQLQQLKDQYGEDDDEEEEEEEPTQLGIIKDYILQVMFSQSFEMFVGFIVIFNFVIIAVETQTRARLEDKPQGTQAHTDAENTYAVILVLNWGFFIFYFLECMLRWFAMGRIFFQFKWNLFDLFMVIGGIVAFLIEAFFENENNAIAQQLVRIFKVLRVARASRILISFQALYVLVSGLFNCFQTLTWAAGLVFMTLTVWSIIAVEYLHPLMAVLDGQGYFEGCFWCPHAFSTILKSNLTFFQMITGDGWSQIARPLIEKYPWTGCIFIGVIFTMMLGLLNLVTAVIVDTAARAQDQDIMVTAQRKRRERESARACFNMLCVDLDKDRSGDISLDELRDGVAEIPELEAYLSIMGVEDDELEDIFECLDTSHMGCISHADFADRLYKMKTQETSTTVTYMKHLLEDIKRDVVNLARLDLKPPSSQPETNMQSRKSRASCFNAIGLVNRPSEAESEAEEEESSTNISSMQSELMPLPGFNRVATNDLEDDSNGLDSANIDGAGSQEIVEEVEVEDSQDGSRHKSMEECKSDSKPEELSKKLTGGTPAQPVRQSLGDPKPSDGGTPAQPVRQSLGDRPVPAVQQTSNETQPCVPASTITGNGEAPTSIDGSTSPGQPLSTGDAMASVIPRSVLEGDGKADAQDDMGTDTGTDDFEEKREGVSSSIAKGMAEMIAASLNIPNEVPGGIPNAVSDELIPVPPDKYSSNTRGSLEAVEEITEVLGALNQVPSVEDYNQVGSSSMPGAQSLTSGDGSYVMTDSTIACRLDIPHVT